jgi:branched-chain amino acid transport system ATP-binding protein
MTEFVLRAEGIHKSFGAVTAALDVNVAFSQGERVSIIGGNGAGKTTFVNMITGFLKPDKGHFYLGNADITHLTHFETARMGLVRSFQTPQLFLEMTVYENLYVALTTKLRARSILQSSDAHSDKIWDVLKRFRLVPRADQLAGELPAGVRKLLDIAMASVLEPKVLMLDEPTSGVSAKEKNELMELALDAIAGQASTLIFIEHDMDIVRNYSSRVVAFYSGSIIADGPVTAVLDRDDVRRYITGGA